MFGKPQNTGLDPRRMRGGLSAPGRQMIKPSQPQRGGGLMGVVNRMPTEDWFRLAGALGQSGQSFLEGVGNAASTMGEMRQERQEQEWQQQLRDMQVSQFERQEQRYEQENQDRAQEQERIAGLRQSVAAHFEQNGNSQMAEIAMNAPEETLGQLLSELTPEGRREVALFNAQMENYQAQSAYRRAQAAAAMGQGAGTHGDYNNQGVERVDRETQQRYFVYTSDDPRDPVMIRDGAGRLLSPEEASEVQSRLDAPRSLVGDSVVARSVNEQLANYGFVDRTASAMVELANAASDPNALSNVTGAVSRVAGTVESQLGAALSLLDDGDERRLTSQVEGLQRDVAEQMPEGIRDNSQAASVFQSLIIEMAFAQARTLNGSGRLSNDDFLQAKRTIVGSDWGATLSNIDRIRRNTRSRIEDTVRADNRLRGHEVTQSELDRLFGGAASPTPAQGAQSGVPEGVPPELWSFMTPEERAAWTSN